MATVTAESLVSKLPDAQFCAGEVILHVESKNVVIGTHISDGMVVLNDAGDAALAATEPAPKKKKAEAVAADAAA